MDDNVPGKRPAPTIRSAADTPKPPNPGSAEAKQLGCKCPEIDNHYGKGEPSPFHQHKGQPFFWVTATCPLHG